LRASSACSVTANVRRRQMDTDILKKILFYIDDHIYEKIGLAELAETAGYSPFYFSKLFSETMGMPITGYIRIRKLQYSLCSLLEGNKVLDVSLMYAFDSHEGFTRSFTRLFGTSPSKVKKYLTLYKVPEYSVPDIESWRKYMKTEKKDLSENMHQIVFEVLRASFEEAKEGFCTEIKVVILADGRVKISDNGRGIPLYGDEKLDKKVLDKILSGHPISNMEYAQMGDFSQGGMQTVNSLCESLQINVYRNGTCFKQDYIRGIAQHEIACTDEEHTSGTEIVLRPDTAIFGDEAFSIDMIKTWVAENIDKDNPPAVYIEQL